MREREREKDNEAKKTEEFGLLYKKQTKNCGRRKSGSMRKIMRVV